MVIFLKFAYQSDPQTISSIIFINNLLTLCKISNQSIPKRISKKGSDIAYGMYEIKNEKNIIEPHTLKKSTWSIFQNGGIRI